MDDYIRVSARVRTMRGIGEKVLYANEANNVVTFRLNNDEKNFSFDYVFPESSSQETVFAQVGKRIIDGCLSGYNGTIFAYGQTGSGKTYTMFGAQSDDGLLKKCLQGIIPRSMDYLFDTLSLKRQEDPSGFSFLVTCSFVQLYNEAIYDLLDNITTKLRIRTDAKNQVYVEGAVVESIQSLDEVLELLRIGFRNRRVAETGMNCESSRSHAIFIVQISTQHSANGLINYRSSRLNLVDLAGSERQSDTQTTGSHLKEAGCINKSLSILTRVIRNLSKNAKQYPGYRDSQLTRLLQDSLGGNAKASVIVNLHPNIEYADTTASTLLFSETVKQIKNNATINENLAGVNVDALRKEIIRLKDEVDQLRGNERVIELEKELEEVRSLLSEKEAELNKVELNQSIVARKENMREALDESLRFNRTMNFSCMSMDDPEDKLQDVVKNFESDELNDLVAKLSESEQKFNALEKRLTKSEKLNENYKTILAKRDESIVQFEGDLAYKARRIENLRDVLEEVQQKLSSSEEEIETLKIKIVKLQKKKAEDEKIIQCEKENWTNSLKMQIQELQHQRDDALKDLSGLTGHTNSKQKINYLSKLRERISSLENENAELKSSTSISNLSDRLRPALRSRGNSQLANSRCASTSLLNNGGGIKPKTKRCDPK